MLKTYQFKTHCKGDIHISETANIILPDSRQYIDERPYVYTKSYSSSNASMDVGWNNWCRRVWILLRFRHGPLHPENFN